VRDLNAAFGPFAHCGHVLAAAIPNSRRTTSGSGRDAGVQLRR